MGHRLSKSLTTILYVCPLRTDISSIPITLGRALGARRVVPHILFVQFLDRLPIKPKLFGNIADGRAPAAFPDIHRKAQLQPPQLLRPSLQTAVHQPSFANVHTFIIVTLILQRSPASPCPRFVTIHFVYRRFPPRRSFSRTSSLLPAHHPRSCIHNHTFTLTVLHRQITFILHHPVNNVRSATANATHRQITACTSRLVFVVHLMPLFSA